MKLLAVLLIFAVAASASVVPAEQSLAAQEERYSDVVDRILRVIEDLQRRIRDFGLDPLQIRRESWYYELPVPVIFTAAAFVENLQSTGLSDIVVNSLVYDMINHIVNFQFEMPGVYLSADAAVAELLFFGENYVIDISGSVSIERVLVTGMATVNRQGDTSVDALIVDASFGVIRSNLRISLFGRDVSAAVNQFIGTQLLETLRAHKAEMDQLVAIVVKHLLNNYVLGY